jgi:hypothetical protein
VQGHSLVVYRITLSACPAPRSISEILTSRHVLLYFPHTASIQAQNAHTTLCTKNSPFKRFQYLFRNHTMLRGTH